MKRILLAVSVFLFLGVNAQAAVIAHWDLYGVGDIDTVDGLTEQTEITAFDMTLGDGLSIATNTSNALNSKGWNDSDSGNYIEFGFSVTEGYEVSLDALWLGSRASATGPHSMSIYSSIDGYSEAIVTFTLSGTSYSNEVFDLSEIVELQAISGDFVIRIYGSDATSSAGTFRITDYYNNGSYTDVQFIGTLSESAVPVPSAMLLLGSGLVALIGIRRKNA